MKKNVKVFIIIILLAVGAVFVTKYSMSDCGACISENDYRFLEKVRNAFGDKEEAIKVSDIHTGNWKEICAYGGGYDANLSYDLISKVEKIVLNSGDPFLTDAHNESAVVFNFGMNEDGIEVIEVFQMTPDILAYSSPFEDCYTRDEAYFKVVRLRNNQINGLRAGTIRAIKLVSGKEI